MPETAVPRPPKTDSSPRFLGAVARLYWMLLGNAVLALIAFRIAQPGPGRTWISDVAFWTVAASLVLVRYLDIVRLDGTTASGEPASLRDWRGYSWRLLLIVLAVWIVSHALGRLTTAMLSGAGVIVWATVRDRI